METIYLICLLVGGFFVALSLLGGGDHGGEVGADAGIDADGGVDADGDFDTGADLHVGGMHDAGAGPGFVDLFSIRALFLFSAFFGLTGISLSLLDSGEPFTAIVALLVGLIVGLGGNYAIKRIGYERVSSDIRESDLRGHTGKVLIPFQGSAKGKITVVAAGQRLQLVARGFGGESIERFGAGDEVVVVRMEGSVAEVVKPE